MRGPTKKELPDSAVPRFISTFEEAVYDYLEAHGVQVVNKGWPDFLCYVQDGDFLEIVCVEVKGKGDVLSPYQQQVHALLERKGIPCIEVRVEAGRRIYGIERVVNRLKWRLSGDDHKKPSALRKPITAIEDEIQKAPAPPLRLIPLREACERMGGVSISTAYRRSRDGTFPPIRDACGRAVVRSGDLDAHIGGMTGPYKSVAK
jgi:predicted DNA-binding transcriptional regulator AlpA